MKALFILNGAPYGDERSYNALRLARTLAKNSTHEVRVFLMGDAVACAKSGQKVPEGFYNIGLMLGRSASIPAQIGVCGTCMDARGISATELLDVAQRSTLDELADWSQWATQVFIF